MSDDAAPLQLVPSSDSTALQVPDAGLPPAALPGQPLERARGAIRRYRWLMLAVILVAIAGGVVATRFVEPVYDVNATIWVQAETPMSQRVGAFKADELLTSSAWVELLKSTRVADAVVRNLNLYVRPASPGDSVALRGFTIAERFAAGRYELMIDRDRKRWSLAAQGAAVDSGAATDSIGKRLGFKWILPAEAFTGGGTKRVQFTVSTPRETAVSYINRLNANLPQGSSFLTMTMHDADPQGTARTMNAWMHEYVNVAAQLKKQNVVEYSNILAGQLSTAERSLHDAENALEAFRVQTITKPGEPGTPIAPGVAATTDPAIRNYFTQKFDYEDLKQDREALEKILSNPSDSVSVEAALLIPSVSQSPSAKALRDAFDQLNKARADLASARQAFTDEYATVKDLRTNIDQLQTQTIPRLAQSLLTQLKEREQQYAQRITTESVDLQAIPARTIEEMRLRRQVDVQAQIYGTIKTTFTQAQLSEASTTPDVRILDSAIAPLSPSKNTAPRLMAMALLAGVGGAIALALLLDMMDKRIRYPEQVTNDLGLSIAAAIPKFPRGTVNTRSPEQIAHLVEAFRSLRMHVRHAGATPITVAISSPQPGDGKSFVSANLAMSFADAGYRTILVDGDTRRGMAHEVFGLSMENGLTDYLAGVADTSQIIRPTSHERLAFAPCGRRRPNGPELLTSAALPRLVAELRNRYDVVLFDTPPLNAGIDAYAIGSAVSNMVVVIRAGKTERRLAAAKLLLADRLPINIMGAVLNAVQLEGEFQYYGYASGYDYSDDMSESASGSKALQKT
jgi:capsular exopolysaccharide synthesis family protein